MNTETPQSELAPEESPNLENVVVTPQEIRSRRGMKRKINYGQYMERVHDDFLLSMSHVNQAVRLITRDNTDSNHIAPYYLNTDSTVITLPSGFSNSVGTSYQIRGVDDFSSLAASTGSVYHPFGRTVAFDGKSWGVSWFHSSGGTSSLVCWGGYTLATPTAETGKTLGADLTVGSTSVTLNSSFATSLKNMLFFGTTPLSPAGDYRDYVYRVTAHTAGTTAVTLDRPWGYGDPAAATLATGASIYFYDQMVVPGAPGGIGTVEVHKNRLFGGRGRVPVGGGTTKSHHANALVWSYPGNGGRWPAQNYIVVDEDINDPITGLASTKWGLFVFKRNKTGLLTGNDEASFAYEIIDGSVGCISDTSICIGQNGNLYWMAEEGVMCFDGNFKNLTNPGPGRGIRDQLNAYRIASGVSPYRLRSTIIQTGDVLLVSENDYDQVSDNGSVPDSWVYNLTTGAWSKFTSGTNNFRPIFFYKMEDKAYAITQNFVADITECYEPAESATASTDYYDEGYASTSTTTTTANVVPVVECVLTPYNRDTGRLQEMEVWHNCQYGNATSSPRDAYSVTVSVDPTFTASVTLALNARYAGNTSTPTYDYYYSQRFTEQTWPDEGAVYKVTFTGASSAILSSRVYRARLYMQPQSTRHGRVDTASL